MRVYNVHQRPIAAPATVVGPLIDTLAGESDRLWPHEAWPAMRFDRPGLTVGDGGHGPVGYFVEHHEPGRSVRFRFTGRPPGLWGTHQFVVQESGADSCVLWHLTEVDARGSMRLTWFMFWRFLHDALIEDALVKAAREVLPRDTHGAPRWNPYVRGLRWAYARASRNRLTAAAASTGAVGSSRRMLHVTRRRAQPST